MQELADGACEPHPHNYHIQLLAETEIVGLLFGCIMIGAIIWKSGITSWQGCIHVISATAVIVPLAFFFPIQSTADFFGQWNNIFMWSALGLTLAAENLGSERVSGDNL